MAIRYHIIPYKKGQNSSRWSMKYLAPTAVFDSDNLYVTTIGAEVVMPNSREKGLKSIIYGLNGVALIRTDIDPDQDELLSSKPDVITFPEVLTNNIPQNVIDNVVPKLEAYNVPMDWLDTSFTYLEALKKIARIFKVFRRLHGKFHNKIFDQGFSLNSQFKDFSSATKSNLIDIAVEYNVDLTQYSNTTTIRIIIKALMNIQSGDTGLGDL